MAVDALQVVIPAAFGVGGVILGGWITQRGQRIERRQRLIREQLSEFYAPMLAYREQLKARGELALKIRQIAESEWRDIVAQAREIGAEEARELEERRWPEFRGVIDYDNKQLRETDIPMYRQMLDLFTLKLHLAEASTRTHLPALVEFIEMWNRYFTGSLPREVLGRIRADEDKLKPLYADLMQNFERLQAALRDGT